MATKTEQDLSNSSGKDGLNGEQRHPQVVRASLSMAELYVNNIFHLPLNPLTLGYKQKVRLILKLRDSADPCMQNAEVSVQIG